MYLGLPEIEHERADQSALYVCRWHLVVCWPLEPSAGIELVGHMVAGLAD
jgi:hypothetical protein